MTKAEIERYFELEHEPAWSSDDLGEYDRLKALWEAWEPNRDYGALVMVTAGLNTVYDALENVLTALGLWQAGITPTEE